MFSVNYKIHEETVAAFLKALQDNDVKAAAVIISQIKEIDPRALPAILSIPCGRIYMEYDYNNYHHYWWSSDPNTTEYLPPKYINPYIYEPNDYGNVGHEELLPIHFAAVKLNYEMCEMLLSFGADANNYRGFFIKNRHGQHISDTPKDADTAFVFAMLNLEHSRDKKACRDLAKLFFAHGCGISNSNTFSYLIDLFLGEGYPYFKKGKTAITLDIPADSQDHTRPHLFLARSYGKIQDTDPIFARRLPALKVKGKPNSELFDFCHALKFAYQTGLAIRGEIDYGFHKDIHPLDVKLLRNTEGSWPKIAGKLENFSINDARSVKDMIREFTAVVALPELLRKTKKQIESKKVDVAKAFEMLQIKVAEFIIGERSIFTVLDLQRDWHRDLPKIETAIIKPDLPRDGEWPALTTDYTASNGLVISFITDSATLEVLSKPDNLNNCLNTYPSSCAMGASHIAVVKKDGKIISSIEFRAYYREKKVSMVQHEGPSASTPSPKAEAARKELEDAINKGSIAVDFNGIKNATNLDFKDLAKICGFDPLARDAKKSQTNALKAYLMIKTGGRADSIVSGSNPFVPGGETKWKGISATKLLKQTGLMDFITNLSKNMPIQEASSRRSLT